MTTFEFYYLTLCMSVFTVFAIVLAYNEQSWKHWKRSQGGNVPAERATEAKMQTKLAA